MVCLRNSKFVMGVRKAAQNQLAMKLFLLSEQIAMKK